MKTFGLCLAVLIVALTANGQTRATELQSSVSAGKLSLSVDKAHLVASDGVTVTIGNTVITADGADVRFAEPGKASDIVLSGTVRSDPALDAPAL
jgi:lipopolysaccharide export system protein LptA